MLKITSNIIGQRVNLLYPVHGAMNVLRTVAGEVVRIGKGPNGDFLTVQESEDKFRTLSAKKIVSMS